MTTIRNAGVRAAILLLAGFFATSPAFGAKAPTRAPVIATVLDCRKLTESDQRLACYDKAVDSLAQADAKGDLITIDREQRRAVRRQAFGLTLPSLAMFDRGEKPDEVDRITAKVATASRNPLGKWIIKLDDGAMWRQIDDVDLARLPRPGSTAVIRKAMMGGFFMILDGQQSIRVHRDN